MSYHISNIIGKEIKDSRGKPTLEVFVYVGDSFASFQVPSGASTGKNEAYELRDTLGGMGKPIQIIQDEILPNLKGINVFDQASIDSALLKLDGTPNKTKIGGNTMIGVSIACAKLAAKLQNKNTYEHLSELVKINHIQKHTPFLYVNLINGGKHSKTKLAFQEYHIVPQTKSIKEALAITDVVISNLEKIILKNGFNLEKGDEGGYALDTEDVFLPLKFLHEAIESSHLKRKVKLAIDVAATSFYDQNQGVYKIGGKAYRKEELKNIYKKMCTDYDIVSIEDPFFEEDFGSFRDLQKELFDTFVVGDDLTTTNIERLKIAEQNKSIKGIIIKPNQVGTLSETVATIKYAEDNSLKCIVSHRSGETMDDFIADLTVAFNCYGIKAGSPKAQERMVKYNRLLKIS